VELTGKQRLTCIGATSTIVVVSGTWKLVLRRRQGPRKFAAA
jgi:hypothetical protein